MFINQQKLIRLPVFTESGEKLGHVHDFEIDVDTHHVRKYIVTSGLISKDTYLVTPGQIISITDEKIVVEDTIIKDVGTVMKKIIPPALDNPLSSIIQKSEAPE